MAGNIKCKQVYWLVGERMAGVRYAMKEEVPTQLTDREEVGLGRLVQSLCPVCHAGAGHDESASVPEGVDVIVEAERRAGGPGAARTALLTAAALDPHDVPVETLTVRAVEAKPHRAREGGCAAAVVSANPTGARAVPVCC